MNSTKKILSLVLSVIMLFSVIPLNAFAEDTEIKTIESVDVTINFDDIANQPVADFASRISVEQEGLRLGTPRVTKSGSTFVSTETFEPGQKYWLSLAFYVEDGYTIEGYTYYQSYGGDIPVSINGDELDFYYKFDMSALQFYDSTYCVYPQHPSENGELRVCLSYSFEVPDEPDFFEKIAQAIKSLFEPIIEFFTKTLAQPIADLIMKLSNMI